MVCIYYIDGLAQDCSNSIANALELMQSCTKPSIWFVVNLVKYILLYNFTIHPDSLMYVLEFVHRTAMVSFICSHNIMQSCCGNSTSMNKKTWLMISWLPVCFLLPWETAKKWTRWDWGKMATILQMTFSTSFFLMKIYVFWFKYIANLFSRFQIKEGQHWWR